MMLYRFVQQSDWLFEDIHNQKIIAKSYFRYTIKLLFPIT